MFRFYELYSLYLKKMSSSCTWCICEKLPRSILHLSPTPEVWCEVCGRRRRPRACLSSSSDEEERAAQRRQQLLAEHRQRNDQEARRGLVRVNVAMLAKKPKPRPKSRCRECMLGPVPANQLKANRNNNNNYSCSNINHRHGNNKNNNHNNKSKTYTGRFGCYRKPQRLALSSLPASKRCTAKATETEVQPQPTAPSPPASLSPPACESLWQQPAEDIPNLVGFAHEVFNHPLHMHQGPSSFYNNLFVSDFIPLNKPITDATGGAISKRRRIFGRSHCSQPLPPLSHVFSEILTKQQEIRAKGGGLAPKVDETHSATQFSPFNSYEGPSEDALVVESARQMLQQPKALYIDERDDLPNTRLSSFETEPSSDCSSSSPFDMPSAPPTENLCHGLNVGPPLRLHHMMKTVTQTGLFDSSASSSSSSESISSHKSGSSALPLRSRGGEEPLFLTGNSAETNISHVSIMEKILWLIEQKPGTNAADHPMIVAPDTDTMENAETDSVKSLMQFMESLQIDSNLMENNIKTTTPECSQTAPNPSVTTAAAAAAAPLPDIEQHSNSPTHDMLNESHLNSTNKSAGDAKYHKGLSGVGGAASSSSSMWSIISGFFGNGNKRNDTRAATASLANGKGELQPLRGNQGSQYGAINNSNNRRMEASSNCQGKHRTESKVLSNCQKCGRIRSKMYDNKRRTTETGMSSECISGSTTYQTAKTAAVTLSPQIGKTKDIDCNQGKSRCKNEPNCKPLMSKDFRNSTDCSARKESNSRSNLARKPNLCKTGKNLEYTKGDKKQRELIDLPKHVENNSKQVPKVKVHDFSNIQNDSRIFRKHSIHKYEKLKKDLNDKSQDFRQVPIDSTKQTINRPIITNDIVDNNMRDQKVNTKDITKSNEHRSKRKCDRQTSSTNFESCFGTSKYSHLKPGRERGNLELQELLQQLKGKVQPRCPKVYHTAKILGLVQYECSEIITPKMSYSRETCVQRINKYYLRSPNSVKSLALLEFRTPDIQKTESNDNNVEKTSDNCLTDSKLGQQIKNDSLKSSLTDLKKCSSKRKQYPVWPAQPSVHRKKSIKVELSYAVSEVDKPRTERYQQSDLNKPRRKKRHDRRIGNYVVQQKINEMMTKPIKLLG